MSAWPQINDWQRQGLDWQYIEQSTMRIFEIPANSQFQLPVGDYTFNYPEGVILQFSGVFDHPTCGIRIEADPNFDTRETFTVNLIGLGLAHPEILVYAIIPPMIPQGFYSVRIVSPWVWEKWLRLYLINTDSVSHRVLGHGYNIAVLKEPRKELAEKVS